ncbi:MAG: 30S ribosomal protein S12 methylthiotransferase RimO [Planctomycetia bacterium]|nr:30S ribosomal protein S12 methylthiotransferase RimO [Planctomycetia bacterium]
MVTCAMISLGCPKNLVDSEQMLGLLQKEGLEVSWEEENAEVVLINTCGFLAASREEGLEQIHAMEVLRRDPNRPLQCLIVAGCLVSRDREKLVAQCPDVDAFLDVFSRDAVVEVVRQMGVGKKEPPRKLENRLYCGGTEGIARDENRFPLLPSHVAYLKIAEGCNRRCAFCAIPNIRGKFVSKPLEEVLVEARNLVKSGVQELILIAQETSFYGKDLADGKTSLAALIRELGNLEGLRWIRVMYLYPQHFDDDLIDALAETPQVVPYLDMPLQHINNRILKSMRRSVSRTETLALLERLHAQIPGLVLRTAVIVGYPGETDAEFEELMAFLRKQRFPRLGVFQFSPEEGTPAAEMEHPVSRKVARKRTEKVMALQRQISAEWVRRQIGTTLDVILDVELGEGKWLGRTAYDAPDVDGKVFVTGKGLAVGTIVPCEIVGGDDYDLQAIARQEPID